MTTTTEPLETVMNPKLKAAIIAKQREIMSFEPDADLLAAMDENANIQFTNAKRAQRAGQLTHAGLMDAKTTFYAVRGLKNRLAQNGAL